MYFLYFLEEKIYHWVKYFSRSKILAILDAFEIVMKNVNVKFITLYLQSFDHLVDYKYIFSRDFDIFC